MDPVYRFTTLAQPASPYGPLFTALTYPLGVAAAAVAYWALKSSPCVCSLAFVWLVWSCATVLGRDPRPAVAFVALNPMYLSVALGGFHNDFFMLVPSIAAIAAAARSAATAPPARRLRWRSRSSSPRSCCSPFLLVGARPTVRAPAVIALGCALAAVPLVALSVALFGSSLPNLSTRAGC